MKMGLAVYEENGVFVTENERRQNKHCLKAKNAALKKQIREHEQAKKKKKKKKKKERN